MSDLEAWRHRTRRWASALVSAALLGAVAFLGVAEGPRSHASALLSELDSTPPVVSTTTFRVEVPRGLDPGQVFQANVPGRGMVDVLAPAGSDGEYVDISLPTEEASVDFKTKVPAGLATGQNFYATVPTTGQSVLVTVPMGKTGGDTVSVHLAGYSDAEHPPPAASANPDPMGLKAVAKARLMQLAGAMPRVMTGGGLPTLAGFNTAPEPVLQAEAQPVPPQDAEKPEIVEMAVPAPQQQLQGPPSPFQAPAPAPAPASQPPPPLAAPSPPLPPPPQPLVPAAAPPTLPHLMPPQPAAYLPARPPAQPAAAHPPPRPVMRPAAAALPSAVQAAARGVAGQQAQTNLGHRDLEAAYNDGVTIAAQQVMPGYVGEAVAAPVVSTNRYSVNIYAPLPPEGRRMRGVATKWSAGEQAWEVDEQHQREQHLFRWLQKPGTWEEVDGYNGHTEPSERMLEEGVVP